MSMTLVAAILTAVFFGIGALARALTPTPWEPTAYWTLYILWPILVGLYVGKSCEGKARGGFAFTLWCIYFSFAPCAFLAFAFGGSQPFTLPEQRIHPSLIAWVNPFLYVIGVAIGSAFHSDAPDSETPSTAQAPKAPALSESTCPHCGARLRQTQVDTMLGNPKYQEWCRKGYCSARCYAEGKPETRTQ